MQRHVMQRHVMQRHVMQRHAPHAQSAAPHHELSDLLAHLDQSVLHAKSVSRESDASAAKPRQR